MVSLSHSHSDRLNPPPPGFFIDLHDTSITPGPIGPDQLEGSLPTFATNSFTSNATLAALVYNYEGLVSSLDEILHHLDSAAARDWFLAESQSYAREIEETNHDMATRFADKVIHDGLNE